MSEVAEEIIFDSVEEAIQDVANGKPVIVTDDENRENEGDLILAASKATQETINLMIQQARGLICVPCTSHHLSSLGLSPMVQENRESHKTDFTVSVDAAEGIATGISAYDRYRTIKLLADPETRPDEFVQPGHIFPLKAKDGGVLERAGHTEAAIDLASLAGLFPCGVVCEILNEDGSMARVPQLYEFKRRLGLKMISIAALIEYRLTRDKLVELVEERPFESEFGPFTLKVFRSVLDGLRHFALVKGKLDETPTLVRVHAENVFTDIFQLKGSRSAEAIESSLRRVAEEGKGALVYISRPDSGFDHLPGPDKHKPGGMGLRDYGIGAQILLGLGLKRIRLLSHSSRNVIALDGYGLEIVEQGAL